MDKITNAIFTQRKFSLALMFTISLIVALFSGFVDGGVFVAGMGTILGLYAAANIGQRWTDKEKE